MRTDLSDLVSFLSTVVGGDISSQSRLQSLVLARAVFAKIAKQEFKATYAEIGRHLGNRTHATVMNSMSHADHLGEYGYIFDAAMIWLENNEEDCAKKDDKTYVRFLASKVSKLKKDMITMSWLEDHEIAYRKLSEDKKKIFKERVCVMLKMM